MKLNNEFLFDNGVDAKRRSIIISGEISERTFRLVDLALGMFESVGKGVVTIKINSAGGSTYDAMAIVGRMRDSKCTIITEGYGCVMSAAVGILAAGDKRRCSKYSTVMYHQAEYMTKGRHKDIIIEVEQAKKEEQQWAQMLADFSKQPKEWWLEAVKSGDVYFTPEQLIEIGVVDVII